MLSPYSQYSPQAVVGQFPGLLFGAPGTGVSQIGGLPFAAGTYGAGVPFGQQFAASNPYQYQQGQPYQQGHWSPAQFMYPIYAQGIQPGSISGGQHVGLQIGSLIGQLAQQVCTQCAIAQQGGLALLQLAQHLIQHSLYGQGFQGLHANSGIGADHLFSAGQQFAGGQPFMTQPFAGPFGPFGPGTQSPYGGLSPQLGPSWSTRPPTIQ
jgi:hypothetical protein